MSDSDEAMPWLRIIVEGEAIVNFGVKLWAGLGTQENWPLFSGPELPERPVVDVNEVFADGRVRRTLWRPPPGVRDE